MPAVWGQKYLDELGAKSWEEIHRLCEEKLGQQDIRWDAKIAEIKAQREKRMLELSQGGQAQRHAPRRKATGKVISYNEETPTTPRPRRIIKIKVRKTAGDDAQKEHRQAPTPASHVTPRNPDGKQDSDGMPGHSVEDKLPDAEGVESLDDGQRT
ncbi:hypothetical protein NCS52_00076800 [Fusarium sp. LHS14.1]|nr:hypothetical protein NCS52_00076800 [Fusarium sp. LHS14.1]